MITLKDVQDAQRNIAPYIHKTPLILSNSLSLLSGAEVHCKLENLQKTGSFKVRGAFNIMTRITSERVVAASMGNHAQAVAFAAQKLGKKAKIVMPLTAPIVKEEATKGYGAEVVLTGERFSDAFSYARAQSDFTFIHPFDDDYVIAGQGTVGIEVLEDLQDIDAVLVPVGGGGLIAGIATAIKALSPRTAVIGVQTEAAASACVSFRERKLVEQQPRATIADGIAIGSLGDRTYEIIRSRVDAMLQVCEDSIARAILLLLERKKLVVEGAGAVPLAALLEHAEQFKGKRVVLVLSGGNIDFALIDRIIRKGLVTSHRIGVLEVVIDDSAGSLHALMGIVASHRANVLDIAHDRLSAGLAFGKARVVITAEVRNRDHLEHLIRELGERGYAVSLRA